VTQLGQQQTLAPKSCAGAQQSAHKGLAPACLLAWLSCLLNMALSFCQAAVVCWLFSCCLLPSVLQRCYVLGPLHAFLFTEG
jgi:hypothetical protein